MRVLPGSGRDAEWIRRLEKSRSPADQILFGEYIGSSKKVREAFLRRLAALPTLTGALKRAEKAVQGVHRELSDLENGRSTSGSWWFKPDMELRWLRHLERFQSEGLFIAGAYLSQSAGRCAQFVRLCRFNPGVSPKLREAASAVEIVYARLREAGSSEQSDITPFMKGAAGLAASILIFGFSVWLLGCSRDAEWVRYATAIGEHRQFVLPDGSVIHLNTGSELRFKATATHRVAELLAGEARFELAKNARPFVAFAGKLAVLDVGTRYTLRRYEDGTVDVMVVEGEVSVNRQVVLHGPLQEGRGYETTGLSVTAGNRAATTESGKQSVWPVPPGEIEQRDAWLDGKVVFDGTPLADVVSEINRYNRRKMRISDQSISGLKISGAKDPRDLPGFLTQLRDIEVRYSVSGTGENVSIELFAAPEPLTPVDRTSGASSITYAPFRSLHVMTPSDLSRSRAPGMSLVGSDTPALPIIRSAAPESRISMRLSV